MPNDYRVLTEAKALAALANPHRTRLLDVLRVDGPATASRLAEQTDLAVGSVSHHLKVLADAGFVEEAPELARDRRERWWRHATPGTRWSNEDFADDPAALAAAEQAENLQLARQFERVRAHRAATEHPAGYENHAFAAQSWLRLTPAELDQVADEVTELLHRWAHREIPDDGEHREPVLCFTHVFPTRP